MLSLVWSTRDQSSALSLQEFVSKLFHFRRSSLFHTPADSEISVQCKDVVPSMLHSSSSEGSREKDPEIIACGCRTHEYCCRSGISS